MLRLNDELVFYSGRIVIACLLKSNLWWPSMKVNCVKAIAKIEANLLACLMVVCWS